MSSSQTFRIRLLTRLLGPLCLSIIRLAQYHANQRSLRRCNVVGAIREMGSEFEVANAGHIAIGDGISISRRVRLSCYEGGRIVIGNNCVIGDNVIIASDRAEIAIGDDCMIAEGVSIRAGNHGTRLGTPIRLQPNVTNSIRIGNDVWIGKGVTIIAGSTLADGCVIGANSVVSGETMPNTIYLGVPARRMMVREG